MFFLLRIETKGALATLNNPFYLFGYECMNMNGGPHVSAASLNETIQALPSINNMLQRIGQL